MTDKAEFKIGDEVYVNKPRFYKPTSTSIIGVIESRDTRNNVHFYVFKDAGFPGGGDRIEIPECDLRHRLGTPLNQLSGRPGHVGYDNFVRIAKSWGFP